jgi:hypothetical protein
VKGTECFFNLNLLELSFNYFSSYFNNSDFCNLIDSILELLVHSIAKVEDGPDRPGATSQQGNSPIQSLAGFAHQT